jgi:lipopolysaccharide/colanic/teichoic acid biosynthesis glycosyltransferase
LLLAYYLRIGSGLLRYGQPYEFANYVRMIALAVPIFLVIGASSQLYDPHQLFGGPQEYAHVVRTCVFGVVVLIVLSFYQREDLLSRAWLLMALVLSIALMGTGRFAFRRLVAYLRSRGLFVTRTLVIGANEQAKAIVRQFHSAKMRGVRALGFLDDYLPPGTPVLDGLEVLGPPSELDRLVHELDIGGVVVVPDALAWESFQEIIREAAARRNGLEIKLSPGFYEILTTGVKVDYSTFVPLLTVDRVRITGIDAVLKNVLDFGLGLVLLVLCGPLIGVLALALWGTQGRPLLDRPRVLGLGGRPFVTWKFHTGLLGSTRRSFAHPLPSVLPTPARGSWLRSLLFRTGLDKLPQLGNVLQGRMSLVGPRTISVGDEGVYGPWLHSMVTVKPGITGPWAVRSVRTLDDEIRLTMYYIRNWTIWLDLQLLVRTAVRSLQRNRGGSGEPIESAAVSAQEGSANSGVLQKMGEEWTSSTHT